MTSDGRVWERLWSALDDPLGTRVVYVYRVNKARRSGNGYIWKGWAFTELPGMLIDDFGSGGFRLLIREGRRMVFSGIIYVEAPRKPSER